MELVKAEDAMSRMSGADILELEVALRNARDSAARRLREIDEALKRIDYGVAGICVDCGGYIQCDQLRADPTTTLCATCQARRQNGRPLPS